MYMPLPLRAHVEPAGPTIVGHKKRISYIRGERKITVAYLRRTQGFATMTSMVLPTTMKVQTKKS